LRFAAVYEKKGHHFVERLKTAVEAGVSPAVRGAHS
jgi:hypothetical protein